MKRISNLILSFAFLASLNSQALQLKSDNNTCPFINRVAVNDGCEGARDQDAPCNGKKMKVLRIVNANEMAKMVGRKLMELDAKSGGNIKAAIVARSGVSLAKLKVMKTVNADGSPRSLQKMMCDISEPSNQGPGWKVNKKLKKAQREMVDGHPQGIRYSHLGIAIKNDALSDVATGRWRVFELLWTCTDDKSSVFSNGMGTFFAAKIRKFEAQVIIPSQTVQENLERMLINGNEEYKSVRKGLHQESYNAAAKWDNLSEQNSNQWPLEMIVTASYDKNQLYSVANRATIVDRLRSTGYAPSYIELGGILKFLKFKIVQKFIPGNACVKNQAFVSEGFGEIVSALSAENWMLKNGITTPENIHHLTLAKPFTKEMTKTPEFIAAAKAIGIADEDIKSGKIKNHLRPVDSNENGDEDSETDSEDLDNASDSDDN